MKLLANDAFFILAFSLCVIVISYLWADKVVGFLHSKSLGKREEILKLLDLMFVETNQRKVTLTMLALSFGLGTVAFLALLPNLMASFIFAAAVIVGGWSIPLLIVKSLYEKRCGLMVVQMVDGLTIMGNGIKSGLSVAQSMERVVENLPNPISQEFGLVLEKFRLGRSLEESLVDLGERVPRADMQMFITAVNILKETGGNLPETFETIVFTIRERQKIEKKIEALTAQGVMQGIIVTMVPIVLLVVFLIIDPDYVKPLFSTTLGLVILLMMFGLQIIGGLTIKKLIKIKV